MDDEDRNNPQHVADWLTPEQCVYLKTVVNYKYTFSAELAEQLEDFQLVMSYGRLLIPTAFGREVARLC